MVIVWKGFAMKVWDEIDKWAENVGKHIHMPRPLSERPKVESTNKYDRLWQKLWNEEINKPITL